MINTNSKFHYAWIILLGVCLVVGISKSGANNGAGLFVQPVANDLDIGVGSLTLYLSVAAVVTMLFLPVGGKLIAKYDTKTVLIGAVLLQAGSFGLFGLMSSVWGWYLLSIPFAMGGAITTIIIGPVLIERWFIKNKGLALGIMTAVGGLMGVFVQPVIGALIDGQGWRQAYAIVGIGTLAIAVPAILFFISKSPAAKNMRPYGALQTASDKGDTSNRLTGIEMADAKKSLAFMLLILFFFIITAISSFAIHIPTYLASQGYGVSFAGKMMSLMMAGVFISSLIFGFLTDKVGAKNVAILAMSLGIISFVLLMAFPQSIIMVGAGLFLFGFFTSSIGTVAPAVTSALFGSLEYSQIYSSASVGLGVASIIALPAYGFIFDLTSSYNLAFAIILIMMALNILFVFMAFRDRDRLVANGKWVS